MESTHNISSPYIFDDAAYGARVPLRILGLVFPTSLSYRGSCSSNFRLRLWGSCLPLSLSLGTRVSLFQSVCPFGFPLGARVPHFAFLRILGLVLPIISVYVFGARVPPFGFYTSPMELVLSSSFFLVFITGSAFAFLGLVFPAVGSRDVHFFCFCMRNLLALLLRPRLILRLCPRSLPTVAFHFRVDAFGGSPRFSSTNRRYDNSTLFSVPHLSFSSYTPAFNILNCRFAFAYDFIDGLFSRWGLLTTRFHHTTSEVWIWIPIDIMLGHDNEGLCARWVIHLSSRTLRPHPSYAYPLRSERMMTHSQLAKRLDCWFWLWLQIGLALEKVRIEDY